MTIKINTDQNPASIPTSSPTQEGLMSAADKTKLDALSSTAVASVKGWSSTGTGISGPVSFRQTATQGIDSTGGAGPVLFINPGAFNQNPKIGDRIIGAVSLNGPNNFTELSFVFEPVVTVDNQIQQHAGIDLSTDTIVFSWIHAL